ncbi:MAG: M3 family metallopeptidase [Myxococcota bacterium]
METLEYVFRRLFPISLPDDVGSTEQGYLDLIALVIGVDGQVGPEETRDAIHLLEQLYEFQDFDRSEIQDELQSTLDHIGTMGLEGTLDRITQLIATRKERETAFKMAVFLDESDGVVSPIERALLERLAKNFGFDHDAVDRLVDEVHAEMREGEVAMQAEHGFESEWAAQTPENNPFLPGDGLPRFEDARAEQLIPAVHTILGELTAELEALEQDSSDLSWALVEGIERIHDRFSYTLLMASHLLSVCSTEPLRRAYAYVQPAAVRFSSRVSQSEPLYGKLRELIVRQDELGLGEGQRRILEALELQARHGGVGLDAHDRERFNELRTTLAELTRRFSENVLDDTGAYELLLTKEDEISGLPERVLAQAAASARSVGHIEASPERGPWRIILAHSSYTPFLTYSTRRDLRERVYRASITIASDGAYDNTDFISEILKARKELAELLGYDTYADMSLASRMAQDVDAVFEQMCALRDAALDDARREHEELLQYARSNGFPGDATLERWDFLFWVERMREELYGLSEEVFRAYLPFEHVLQGLFNLIERLFSVSIRANLHEVQVWNDDVRVFDVYEGDERIAMFFLDPYARPGTKRSGAWHSRPVGRSRAMAPDGAKVRIPVSYMVCNQAPPVQGEAATISFREMNTLFHEFGHGLQHMLTRVDHGLASGIDNIEWDAVELPSQFMENWCYEARTLRTLTSHVSTQEPLGDELIQKVRDARVFRAGYAMTRQVFYALLDMELHARFDPTSADADPFALMFEIAQSTTYPALVQEDRLLNSFSHIFAGGYAAGYYAYKWAEIMSADAFSAFEEAGLGDPEAVAEVGQRFRETVLAMGGSRHPAEVFDDFRGRGPCVEALLRQNGLEVPA